MRFTSVRNDTAQSVCWSTVSPLTYSEHAWLYDAAFSWDVSQEVAWLVSRFRAGAKRLIEPGCGSGRMMPDFARHGIEVVGIDASKPMLARAAARMRAAGLPTPALICADMVEFSLDAAVDGALCSIQTFAHLKTRDDALRHLSCVRRALRPGGKYLVQLGLEDTGVFRAAGRPNEASAWVVEVAGRKIRTSWFGRDFDPRTLIQYEVCRFEVLSGEGAGSVFEDMHEMHVWSWAAWSDVIRDAGFQQTAAFDGREDSRPPVEPGEHLNDQPLMWHELCV